MIGAALDNHHVDGTRTCTSALGNVALRAIGNALGLLVTCFVGLGLDINTIFRVMSAGTFIFLLSLKSMHRASIASTKMSCNAMGQFLACKCLGWKV